MGSVVLLNDIANKTCFCDFYRSIYHCFTIYLRLLACCIYTLDVYDIMAFNQNLYGENDWDFYSRKSFFKEAAGEKYNCTSFVMLNYFRIAGWTREKS